MRQTDSYRRIAKVREWFTSVCISFYREHVRMQILTLSRAFQFSSSSPPHPSRLTFHSTSISTRDPFSVCIYGQTLSNLGLHSTCFIYYCLSGSMELKMRKNEDTRKLEKYENFLN